MHPATAAVPSSRPAGTPRNLGLMDDLPELMKVIEQTRDEEPEREPFVILTRKVQ